LTQTPFFGIIYYRFWKEGFLFSMLRYNWQRIFAVGNGSATECYRIFKMLALKEIPKNKYDPIYWYSTINFLGDSFLKHPEVLIKNSNRYKCRDLCIYLALASQRSYAQYKVAGTLTLELIHSKIDPRGYLYDKTLIPVKNGILIFPYEENRRNK